MLNTPMPPDSEVLRTNLSVTEENWCAQLQEFEGPALVQSGSGALDDGKAASLAEMLRSEFGKLSEQLRWDLGREVRNAMHSAVGAVPGSGPPGATSSAAVVFPSQTPSQRRSCAGLIESEGSAMSSITHDPSPPLLQLPRGQQQGRAPTTALGKGDSSDVRANAKEAATVKQGHTWTRRRFMMGGVSDLTEFLPELDEVDQIRGNRRQETGQVAKQQEEPQSTATASATEVAAKPGAPPTARAERQSDDGPEWSPVMPLTPVAPGAPVDSQGVLHPELKWADLEDEADGHFQERLPPSPAEDSEAPDASEKGKIERTKTAESFSKKSEWSRSASASSFASKRLRSTRKIFGGKGSKTLLTGPVREITWSERALGLVPSKNHNGVPNVSENDCRAHAERMVRGLPFEVFTFSLMLMSTAVVGLQTDHMARKMLDQVPRGYRCVDLFFSCVFGLEVAIRLFVFRCRFFIMWGCGWNVFDLTLVLVQVAEEVITYIAGQMTVSGSGSSSVLRIVRVLRAVKVIRVLRMMRFTAGLRLIVSCILHSVKSFFWAVILLFTMIYVVSTYLTQMVLQKKLEGELPPEVSDNLDQLYGNVATALLTVFQGLTGGLDWYEMVQPVIDYVSPWVGLAYVAFIAFSLLAICNVVTSVFVENAIERAAEVGKLNKVDQARKLFRYVDMNGNGTISYEEIEAHLLSPMVQSYFRSIDIDASDAKQLFELLDFDGSGYLDFEEFLGGCLRMQGPAKTLDVLMSNRDMRGAFDEQSQLLTALSDQLTEILNSMTPVPDAFASFGASQMEEKPDDVWDV